MRSYEVSFPASHKDKKGNTVYEQDENYLNTKPKGTRWKLDEMPNGTKFWRREEQQQVLIGSAVGSEIITNYQNVSIATHELAHRMESTVPGIVSMERKFWEARQKDEDVTQIPGHPQGEVGIRDDFVDAYMGKVYPYSRNFEILSMGVEAVFHGHDGGLVGMSNSAKSDIEMRDFVLGTFATVGLEGNVDNLSSESALDW